jgi:hypothetical protein
MNRKYVSAILALCTLALTCFASPAEARGGWGHGGGWHGGWGGYHHGWGGGPYYGGGYGSGFALGAGLGFLGGAALGRRRYPYPYEYGAPYAPYPVYGPYGYPPPVNVYTRAYPW